MDLEEIRERLEARGEFLNSYATRDEDALREIQARADLRSPFFKDSDKIIHSWSFTRYTGKTQVFFTRTFDMMSSRMIHVQLVSKIARHIGRVLGFNQDLIEAIALGHDIGHPPYGHVGEESLSKISNDKGLGHYWHNYQAIRWLRDIESHNLTLQTLDGILCHNGESRSFEVTQAPTKTFEDLTREMETIQGTNSKKVLDGLRPMTPEGCIVRLCDVIGYVGRDIEDAIVMKVIERDDVPEKISEVLGSTNKQIVNTLVNDLIVSFVEDYPEVVFPSDASTVTRGDGGDSLRFHFSDEIREATGELMTFNYKNIYLNPKVVENNKSVEPKMRLLFDVFLGDIEEQDHESPIFYDHIDFTKSYLADRGKVSNYGQEDRPGLVVRDFIAGMTERYFERLAEESERKG
ncbi:MAG: deoxyguanosinetriphosphate triphosphohydrolase family protein [Promethearchaeota archaeon]